MGTALIRVTPEVLANFVACLPRSCKIVGSRRSDDYVVLVLESDMFPEGEHDATAIMRIDGLTQSMTIELL